MRLHLLTTLSGLEVNQGILLLQLVLLRSGELINELLYRKVSPTYPNVQFIISLQVEKDPFGTESIVAFSLPMERDFESFAL